MKQLAFFLLCSFFSLQAFALRFEGDKNVTINEDVYEDIYVAGGDVTINGKVFGDVFAMGGEVTLKDSVSGDVMAGGGKVYIFGWVGDDIRVAGGQVEIRQGAHGDLIVTGGEVDIDSQARIDGDFIAASGDIKLSGNVMGNAKIAAGELVIAGDIRGKADLRGGDCTINGRIGGPCEITVDELDLGSSARFESPVRYWTEDGEMDFGNALGSGATATYDATLKKMRKSEDNNSKPFWGKGVLGGLWYFISLGLLGALLQFLFGRRFAQAAALGEGDTFEMLLRGFLFFVATPVLAIMLLITVVGIPIGLLLGGLYLMLLAASKVITAAVGAQWLKNRQGATWTLPMLALVTVALLFLLKSLAFIPFLGKLAGFGLVCVAFGAIYTLFQQRNKVLSDE